MSEREWTRVPALMFPQCSLDAVDHQCGGGPDCEAGRLHRQLMVEYAYPASNPVAYITAMPAMKPPTA
jgi:hypothetical protein